MQSILSAGFIHLVSVIGGFILSFAWGSVPALRFSLAVFGVGVLLWIVLMIMAYRGIKYKLPVFGNLAEKLADGHPHQRT
jgi:uncharacterized membrane protein